MSFSGKLEVFQCPEVMQKLQKNSMVSDTGKYYNVKSIALHIPDLYLLNCMCTGYLELITNN